MLKFKFEEYHRLPYGTAMDLLKSEAKIREQNRLETGSPFLVMILCSNREVHRDFFKWMVETRYNSYVDIGGKDWLLKPYRFEDFDEKRSGKPEQIFFIPNPKNKEE